EPHIDVAARPAVGACRDDLETTKESRAEQRARHLADAATEVIDQLARVDPRSPAIAGLGRACPNDLIELNSSPGAPTTPSSAAAPGVRWWVRSSWVASSWYGVEKSPMSVETSGSAICASRSSRSGRISSMASSISSSSPARPTAIRDKESYGKSISPGSGWT